VLSRLFAALLVKRGSMAFVASRKIVSCQPCGPSSPTPATSTYSSWTGYVDLDPHRRRGVGAFAHAEFAVPVIGVAKTAFRAATHALRTPHASRFVKATTAVASVSTIHALMMVTPCTGVSTSVATEMG
jgi:hypothetical protein